MDLRSKLRELLGEQWGKMLALLLLLALFPVAPFADGQYELGATLLVIFVGPFIAYVVIRYYRDTPKGKAFISTLKDLAWGFGALAGLGVGVWLAILTINTAYHDWLPHTWATLVYTNSNWMQGEKRNCVLATETKPYQLDCTISMRAEQSHEFDVTYTGADPADLDKSKPQSWTCTREASSISCKKQE